MIYTAYNWNLDVSWAYHLCAIDLYFSSPVKMLPQSFKASLKFRLHHSPCIKIESSTLYLVLGLPPLSPSLSFYFPFSLSFVFLACFLDFWLQFLLSDFTVFFLLLVRLNIIHNSYKSASFSSNFISIYGRK